MFHCHILRLCAQIFWIHAFFSVRKVTRVKRGPRISVCVIRTLVTVVAGLLDYLYGYIRLHLFRPYIQHCVSCPEQLPVLSDCVMELSLSRRRRRLPVDSCSTMDFHSDVRTDEKSSALCLMEKSRVFPTEASNNKGTLVNTHYYSAQMKLGQPEENQTRHWGKRALMEYGQ